MTEGSSTPMFRTPATPRQRLAEDIMQLARELSAVHEQLAHAFAERNDLHPTDVTALVAVMHAEAGGHPITAGDLGTRLGMTSGAVTRVVDRLERTGHLRRRRSETDRRKVHLHYGARGQQAAVEYFGPLGARIDVEMTQFTESELTVVRRFLDAYVNATKEVIDNTPH
ncbi:MarR family winged helix-turn-helix transcriptional regulator [Amycolatopsis sp. NPDC004625]|uniref:MarR family winged helix-turn-helix transcriptional regulator n=1 Tax=Amycolatopsis sp. NPDC004625 TaxID=3154670 RepID=UPI0033B0215D